MRADTLAHLSDADLLRDLALLIAQDRLTTATLLAHLAEVDARKLYLPAGYPSMHAYCVEELGLSEDAALRRIQAARAARQFPVLLHSLAEGRLHLTAVCLLAPHLTPENLEKLVEGASHRRKAEIQELLARRFPLLRDSPAVVRALGPAPLSATLRAGAQDEHALAHVASTAGDDLSALARIGDARAEAETETGPLSSERFLVQLTVARSTHDKLRYAQALLSHAVPSGDLAQVLDRALDALIAGLEKRRFGAATPRPPRQPQRPRQPPRHRQRSTARSRYLPAHVRRAVWERDQGQCTFVSPTGHRCEASRFLEFDHRDAFARGGEGTVEGLQLRCRAHNQYEAERTFGADFMSRKRHEARLERRVLEEPLAGGKARPRGADREAADKEAAAEEQTRDVLAGLRSLGCRAHEARRAAEYSETLPGASLEVRMRAALTFLSRRSIQGRRPGDSMRMAEGAKP